MSPDPTEKAWISGVSASTAAMSVDVTWLDVNDDIERTFTITQTNGKDELVLWAPWTMERRKVKEILAKLADQIVPSLQWDEED